MQKTWFAALALLAAPATALSDMSIDLLRMTCVPELRYFEVEGKSYSILAEAIVHGFDNFSPEGVNRRLKLLEAHGLYSPRNLKYTCKLPETTFELVATQPPASERGMCGASPTASFSLFLNGKEWFRNVPINEGCFDRLSVTSITMSVGKRGWKADEVIVCVKEKPASEAKCHFSGATFPDYGLNNEFPITEQSLRKVISK